MPLRSVTRFRHSDLMKACVQGMEPNLSETRKRAGNNLCPFSAEVCIRELSMMSDSWRWLRVAGWLSLLGACVAAGFTYPTWWPRLTATVDAIVHAQKASSESASDGHGDHAGHDHAGHDHAAHSDKQSLELTAQALKNLGLTSEFLKPIQLSNYQRTISVPAIIAPKPGRTQIRVSSPLSGVVLHVHAVTGEAVTPGEMLFRVRLTYEELVDTQTQFLKTLSELEVEKREITRLDQAVQSGAVPGKSLIERRYAKEKLDAYLTSLREALKLHGLSTEQVQAIETDRKLLRDLTIIAPDIDSHDHEENLRLSKLPIHSASYRKAEPPKAINAHSLIVEDLKVEKGQGVTSGETLCTLSDFSELYIEGRAFEQDAPSVSVAAEKAWTIDALFPSADGQETVKELKLAYVANSVDPASRTLSFYVELPNQILRSDSRSDGKRFISWKYRVGQRLQLLVPVEVWQQQIVLPVDAVVKDGTDWFVFQQNGSHFDRVPVHVKYRDQNNIVIDNDGAIFPGDVIALRSAHQLQMAIKNKSGGAVDPHAGHNH